MTSCKRNLGVEEALVVLAAVVNGCSQWTKKKGTFWCRENEVNWRKKKTNYWWCDELTQH